MASPFLKWLLDPYVEGDWDVSLNSEHILSELTDLFVNWRERVQHFSHDEQNTIIWRIIGYPLHIGIGLVPGWDLSPAPIEVRLDLISAMKHVTLAIPFLYPDGEPIENGYFMCWDAIAEPLTDRSLIDHCFETLCELIEHPDERVRSAAAHGLGHLDHADRPKVLRCLLDRERKSGAKPDYLSWLEQCADGTIM